MTKIIVSLVLLFTIVMLVLINRTMYENLQLYTLEIEVKTMEGNIDVVRLISRDKPITMEYNLLFIDDNVIYRDISEFKIISKTKLDANKPIMGKITKE